MGLWDKLKGELIDIVEWVDTSGDTIVYKFERYGNEIKNGAKLVVREGQVAVFVNEGEIADVFSPGTYTLETKNLPILSTLQGWKYGFNSPFKAEVFFVATKTFTNMKWGTPNVVYYADPKYGDIPLRAFGTFSFKVVDAPKFIRTIVGTLPEVSTEEIVGELRSIIATNFADALGETELNLTQVAGRNLKDLSLRLLEILQQDIAIYGLKLVKFLINNINLPEYLEQKLQEGAAQKMVGANNYQELKMGEAMGNVGQSGNVSGGVEGMMGMAMMQMMMNQNQQRQAPVQGAAAPPPPPVQAQYYIAMNGQQMGPYGLEQIRQMIASGQVNNNTYIWKQGMANWLPASSVPEIAALFGQQTPPPPPPQM